jgi:RNase P subunit RPR2
MTNGYQDQPDEVERPACSCCGSFLCHGKSILRTKDHPGYAVMHCVMCGFTEWISLQTVDVFRDQRLGADCI